LETEPTWVFNCLSRCQGADRDCLSPRGPRKPGAAPTAPEVWQAKETAPVLVYGLLSGLAQTAPYPRLAEAAHRALLALEQRDTAAASREAELLGLEASLAEAKASGDQLQCRLGQIESSWSAAMRASELADLALETGNILMHVSVPCRRCFSCVRRHPLYSWLCLDMALRRVREESVRSMLCKSTITQN
uniref:BRO1 domain-containing protein n=1 Tax=Schistocephalus solidus TaxID=70667 RepID=A0A183SAK6_SCHSO